MAQVTDTAFSLSGGTYFVTVTDTAGCISIDSITLQTNFPEAILALGADTTVCANDYLVVAPSGYSTYTWNTGSLNDSLTVTSTGTYTLEVTDSNGCSATDSIVITLNAPIEFSSVLVNTVCQEDTGSIALTITSGNGGYTFNWSTGDTTSSIDSLSAGTYSVTVSDTVGCDVSETFNLVAPDAPVLTLNGTDANCFGEAGNISFFATGGAAPYSYAWSNGSIGDPNPVTAGSYVVTLTDDSGCVVIDSITIAEPAEISIDIAAVLPNCGDSNGSVLATVSNTQGPVSSYLWNDVQNSTTPAVDSLPAGFYVVTVTDSAGCSAMGSIALSDSGAANLSLFATQNDCSNEAEAFAVVNATGGAPFTYLWNDLMLQTTDTAFNLSNGTYAVSVTDTNGCVAMADTQITSINDAPVIDLGPDRTACNDSETILTAGGGFATYFWNTGATTPSIVAFGSQVYGLTVTDAAGCAGSDTVSVDFVNPPVVDLGPDTVVCVDDLVPTVTLSAGEGFLSYQWSTNDTTSSIQINSGGLYGVTVSNAPECFGSDHRIVVFDTCFNVSLEELIADSAIGLTVYPNPNRGVFDVSLDNIPLRDANILIRNTTGQLFQDIALEDHPGSSQEIHVDLSMAPKGVYVLTLITDGVRIDRRVIVQ